MKKNQAKSNGKDILKWFLVAGFLVAGFFVNNHFSDLALSLRAAGWIVLTCGTVFLAITTTNGQVFWRFLKASKQELRKVVWPSRQEAMQTTMLVIGLVALMALILWAVDSSLFALVGMI